MSVDRLQSFRMHRYLVGGSALVESTIVPGLGFQCTTHAITLQEQSSVNSLQHNHECQLATLFDAELLHGSKAGLHLLLHNTLDLSLADTISVEVSWYTLFTSLNLLLMR